MAQSVRHIVTVTLSVHNARICLQRVTVLMYFSDPFVSGPNRPTRQGIRKIPKFFVDNTIFYHSYLDSLTKTFTMI